MMTKRISIFIALMIAIGADNPVLCKEKGASAGISPGTDRTIDMLTTLKKRLEIFVSKSGCLGEESARYDLNKFRANKRQQVKSPMSMKTIPAIGKGDSAFRDQSSKSDCGTGRSFSKMPAIVKNNNGPEPKVMFELVKMDVYSPRKIAGIPGNGKTGAILSGGADPILTSKSIDTLLDRLNKNAFINLGQLAPAFFDKLIALDGHHRIEAGTLPKLSTSNGKPAKLSLGSKNYYRKKQYVIPTVTASKAVSPKAYEMVDNQLTVELKLNTPNDEELNLGISVTISDSIENPGESPGKPVISKSEANLPFHSGDIIVLGGLGQLESRDTPTHDPSYKWVFMGLPKPKSGIITLLFIKPTIIR
ncbi:hypothetical protein [Mucilaginibacter sp. 3215]|uniref:hypothetical protein n=1 Tax=Mucilaginibacter sp. 3215 TaxID=3373912 RepID=UPI003D2622DD